MTGTIALLGGGEFSELATELDRRLLAGVTGPVVILPTADAFERPEHGVERGIAWFRTHGIDASVARIMRRGDASDPAMVEALRSAGLVYLFGDSPMHLRSVMKDTPAWQALLDLLVGGGTLAASAGAAAGLCDPMVDPRGGAFTLGLGLVGPLALVTQAETWSNERLKRTLDLASGFPVATLPSGAALVHTAAGWDRIGAVEIHGGELPTA